MDSGISVHSSDCFHCSCLLWKGHIMDNWQTLFISQCTAVLLCTIFIYCSLRWNTSSLNTKTEWHYLLAVVIRFFFFFFIPSFHSFDSTKHPHSTQKYHMHTTSSFSHVQMEALPGLSTIANMALLFFFFFSAGSHQSLFWQHSFWYLYFHRILITLRLSFHVSPLLACSLPRAVVLFYNGAPRYRLFHSLTPLYVFSSGL